MKRIFVVLLSLIAVNVYAQDKIESERPNESITPKTLSKHSFQTEIGFRRTKQEGDDKVWRTPNALFRFGVSDKIELRLETSVEHQKLVSENIVRKGLLPVELGLKANIFETKNEAFSSSIVGHIGIPTLASSDHKSDDAYHRIRLLFENKLSDKIKLNYNVGSDWDTEDQEQNWMYSFAPEFEIGDHWETFVELVEHVKKDKTPEGVADAGFAYYISKSSKVDLSAGVGLNNESPKYFVAAGLSIRFGK